MVKSADSKEIKPVRTLHFTEDKYPDVVNAINKLAIELDRKPHDAMRTLAKVIESKTDEIVSICNS